MIGFRMAIQSTANCQTFNTYKKMRKYFFALGLALAALALPSCSQNEELDVTEVVKPSFELFANIDTRTVNNGLSTAWAEGDELNVFHAVANEAEYVNDNAFTLDDLATGLFKGELKSELTAESYDWFALYPYSKYVSTPAATDAGYITVGGTTQTQNGNNSMAHLAGNACPLVGVAKGVAANVSPVFTMNHASSVVKFTVKNSLQEAITVSSVALTAPQEIVGTFYVNFVDYPAITYTGSGANYVSNVATLNVNEGAAIAPGATAEFYVAIKPFTLEAGDEITVSVTASAGENSGVDEAVVSLDDDAVFNAGHIKNINVNFDTELAPEVALELPFSETFEKSQGDFTIEDIELGSLTYVWGHDANYKCMKASGYKGGAVAAKSKLVSPLIAIPAETEGTPILTFDHAIGYGNETTVSELTLWVKTKTTEWTEVTIPTYPTISSSFSPFVSSGDIDLSAYKGENIYIAFEYSSTTAKASTWEIKNVKLEAKKFSQTIAFAEPSYSFTIGDTFEGQQVTGAKTTVTYASDNADVAAVDAATGAVTLGSVAGTATITATAAEDATYSSATASYTITLVEAGLEFKTATFVFNQKSGNSAETITRHEDYITCVVAKADAANNPNEYSDGSHLRFMGKNTMTLSGATIREVLFTFTGTSYAKEISASVGTIVKGATSSVWTGENTEVVFTNTESSQARIISVEVKYTVADDAVMKSEQTLSFAEAAYTAVFGEEFTAPTVEGAQTTVTYTSSNTEVATVDETTGAVTLVAAGSTTITATAAESDLYYSATASYTLTVSEPVVTPPAGDGDQTPGKGTVLWSDDFASYGATSTTFASNKTISAYTYDGRKGYGDNATSVTLTADASNNVRCTTSSGGNCTSGHLWFNKSVNGTLTTSAIKLYGATSLTFSHSQGTSGSSCTSEYSTDGGSTWTQLGTQSGAIETKSYNFTVAEGTESIVIRLSHPATNAKNTRVDNLKLVVAE